ncbi:MAG TPA: DUF305 domain-containing protein [Steroidobacteraceae bacterium]|nr:DUF305 domain-containing protein [Steroidobacteraceae bacterium]
MRWGTVKAPWVARALCLGLGISAAGISSVPAERPDEQSFLRESDVAMQRMMAGMAIAPSGDVDRDFVNLMAAHHQGAIDMSVDVLRYSRNERIRRIAQEIIVEQEQQIAAMHLAVGDPPPPGASGAQARAVGP